MRHILKPKNLCMKNKFFSFVSLVFGVYQPSEFIRGLSSVKKNDDRPVMSQLKDMMEQPSLINRDENGVIFESKTGLIQRLEYQGGPEGFVRVKFFHNTGFSTHS